MRVARVPTGTIDAHVHIGRAKHERLQTLVAAMDRVGLSGAVLVQYRWHADDSYLLEAAHAHPGRFAVVGYVDPAGQDPVRQLEREVAQGLVGIRLPPDAAAPIWETAEALGLVVSVTGPLELLAAPAFADLARRLPRLRFRLEHLGGIRFATAQPELIRSFLRLAERPNVWTMWSGFWLNAGDSWPYPVARHVVRESLHAFGPDRICWSGDRDRPELTDERYVAEAALLAEGFGVEDPVARAAILGGTARTLFGLGPGQGQG